MTKPLSSAPPPPRIDHAEDTLQPVAAVLACLIPGAGHAYLGDIRRGVLIFTGVLGLFFGGILVGGIDVVDRREDFIWFLGQALVGPIALATDNYHQNHLKVIGPAPGPEGRNHPILRSAHPYEVRDPRTGHEIQVRDERSGAPLEFTDPATGNHRMSTPMDRPPNVKSIGRPNELGTLMGTIAGMMNLICIIDAGLHRARRSRGGKGGW